MKSRIYQIAEDSAEFKVFFFGCNLNDLFQNSYEGFKRLIYKKNPNRPEPKIPNYPLMQHTLELSAKDPEALFVEWLKTIHHLVVKNRYMPLTVDYIQIEDNHLKAQVSFRLVGHKDKYNHPIKAVHLGSAHFEPSKNGTKISVVFDI